MAVVSPLRKKAFEVYPTECDICKSKPESDSHLHVHHRDRDRQNNAIENLQILCRACHSNWHWQERHERQEREARERLDTLAESESRRWMAIPKEDVLLSIDYHVLALIREHIGADFVEKSGGLDRVVSAKLEGWIRGVIDAREWHGRRDNEPAARELERVS